MNAGLQIDIERLGTAAQTLVQDLHLQVPAGEILTLMGPSGCGKSSVLAATAGTLASVSEGLQPLQFDGRVQLNGRDLTTLPTHQRGIGLVFQDALLFAHMTVAENLLFAVPRALPPAQRQARVQQALQEAELTGMGERDPSTLSGGQRARVALMRALLAEPQALLLDEPFSKLDAALRAQLRPWVFAHVRERRIPVVLVTHDEQDVADPQRVVHLRATEESPSHV
ncbi:ATP-binding cassette domain-containing protein [Limnohabitans sp. 15K]|uniref:ATP-binding cassette domain-containing protein n=1 Tax=Limnohabitans sp. 15K TaxID=1100706 RepID=UPI000C1F4BD2|nr:ATP-binding cassette domain-containing protein [Limnohabitans sp. 15K]PIT83630.1 ABC transporter ATP-binding protein [Limnohabitans sp. 15K]